MKALSSLLLVLAICVATVIPSGAADDKQLTNMKGDVTYQQGTGAAKPVALNAHVSLSNNDFANTGANSQATITLPDSSQVLIGQLTKIQMLAFDQQPGLATASFFLYQGKTRFAVKHPGGAKANYTFQTSTGQIAVRGTEGDISLDASTLQVNVYALGDPNLPVEVSLNNGKKYELRAGQALVVGITGAVIAAAAVSSLSSTMTSTFAEFGPANAGAGAAGGAAGAGAAGAAAGVAPAAVAAGAAAVAGAAVVAGATKNSPAPKSTPKPTPSPSPTPKPTPSPTASPTTSPSPTPTASPTPGDVGVTPSQFGLGKPGATQTISATQSGNTTKFSAQSLTPTIVSVAPGSAPNEFVVTAVSAGAGQVQVTGTDSKSKTVTANVASGQVTTPSKPLTLKGPGATATFTVSESGYNGSFTATSTNTSVATVGSSASGRTASDTTQTFKVIGGSTPGSTTIHVTDSFGNAMTPDLGVTVGAGKITIAPAGTITIQGLNQPAQFTASESGFQGTFKGTASGITITNQQGGLFKVESTGYGSASVVVSDGLGNTATANFNVTHTPTPAPSTTCVPIIINGRHGGRVTNSDASPCPTTAPTAAPTAAPTTAPTASPSPSPPPRPRHGVAGAQPPTGPPAKKPVKTEPKHQPVNPMHPMQPLTGPQGAVTPPPLPIPPGGSPP